MALSGYVAGPGARCYCASFSQERYARRASVGDYASQSKQAPMATVTALLLPPNQGGMTAPKPPAGPPAATTSRLSSPASAAYSWSPREPTTAPFPQSRSEEHTSELQSLMRISYAVFCLKKKTTHN